MANKYRGEHAIKIGKGADARIHTLHFGVNVMCDLEESYGKPFVQFAQMLEKAQQLEFTAIRLAFQLMSQRDQPGLTIPECGAIMDEIGVMEAAEAVAECIRKSLPDDQGEGDDKVKKKPNRAARRKAASGKGRSTGQDLSGNGARQAET